MQRFWVVGGSDEGARFRNVPRADEDWFGPFDTYAEAKEVWAKHAWRTVDDVYACYRIERFDPDEAPRCSD